MKRFIVCACLLAIGAATAPSPWIVAIDSRTTDQWMAESPGRAYAERDGRLTALDDASGSVLWSTTVPTNGQPAVAKNGLAVASGTNVLFLDPDSGKVRARVADVSIAPAGSSSDIVMQSGDNALRGYDGYGRAKWGMGPGTKFEKLESLGGNLVAAFGGNGALFVDASNGKAVAAASDVDDVVGSDGRYLWFTVRDGGLKGLDLNTNRSFAIHNALQRNQVSVEHARAVAVDGGRLTLIDLRTQSLTPLRIYGRWIGGPIAGTIFIERGDGLYVQRLDAGARPVRIAAYESEARFTTSDRAIGYVGLKNGTVLVVDMMNQRLIKRIATGCNFYEGIAASGGTTIVHCDVGTKSRLVGFARERSS